MKYVEKANKDGVKPNYSLPESDKIYYKDFHFLEETLIERQNKKDDPKNLKKSDTLSSSHSNK